VAVQQFLLFASGIFTKLGLLLLFF